MVRKVTRSEILNGNPVKVMFVLSLPIMVSQLLQVVYNLTDTFWLGHLPASQSGSAVAGMQISWPLIWFLIAFSAGFGMAGVALVSQYMGAGDRGKADFSAAQVMSLAIILGVSTAVIGALFSPLFARFVTKDAEVVKNAVLYLRIIFLGLPFMFIAGVFQSVLSAEGDTVTPMHVNLFTITLNIVLDPILILGLLGFPRLGIRGAALATVFCQGIASVMALYILFSGKRGIRIYLKDLLPNLTWMKKIFKIGLPAAIGSGTTAFGFLVVIGIIGRVHNAEVALAAYGIGDRMISLEFIIVDALSTAIATLIGQNLGANLTERVSEIAKKGLLIEIAITLIESVLLFALRVPLFKLFIPDRPDILSEGAKFVTIFMIGIPFFGIIGAISALFGGSGHNKPPMIVDIVRLWVLRIPLAFLLSLKYGSVGIWWGMALSNIGAALIAFYFYFKGDWKKPVIEEAVPNETPISANSAE